MRNVYILFGGIIVGLVFGISLERARLGKRINSITDNASARNASGNGSNRDISLANDIFQEAANPHSPIKLDTNLNEYQLVYRYETAEKIYVVRIPLHYCPWTGKELEPSKRTGAIHIVPGGDPE